MRVLIVIACLMLSGCATITHLSNTPLAKHLDLGFNRQCVDDPLIPRAAHRCGKQFSIGLHTHLH